MTENATGADQTVAADGSAGTEAEGGTSWMAELMGVTPAGDQDAGTAGSGDQEPAENPDQDPEVQDDLENQDQDPEDDLIELKAFDKAIKLTPDKVLELAQKQFATDVKLDEVKEQKRQFAAERQQFEATRESFRSFLTNLKSPDPATHAAVYAELAKVVPGMPAFADVVSAFVERELEWHGLSDIERRERLLNADRQQIEAERKRIQDEHDRKQFEAAQRESYTAIMTTLPQALNEAGLPQTRPVLRRVAETWIAAIERDAKLPADKRLNPTAAKVTQIVKAQLEQERLEHLSGLSEDEILQKLPPEIVNKVNKASVNKLRNKFKPTTTQTAQKSPSRKPREYVSASDWFKERGL